MHKAKKSTSISYYILKPPSFLVQDFKDNIKAYEKRFRNMCDFGARTEWRSRRRSVIFYLGVETSKYQ